MRRVAGWVRRAAGCECDLAEQQRREQQEQQGAQQRDEEEQARVHHRGRHRVRRGECDEAEQPQHAAALGEVEPQRVGAEEQCELAGDGHRQEGAVVALADAAADPRAVVIHDADHAAAHRAELAARRSPQLRAVAEALGQRRARRQPGGGGEGLGGLRSG